MSEDGVNVSTYLPYCLVSQPTKPLYDKSGKAWYISWARGGTSQGSAHAFGIFWEISKIKQNIQSINNIN
jgi:hypothetical protein